VAAKVKANFPIGNFCCLPAAHAAVRSPAAADADGPEETPMDVIIAFWRITTLPCAWDDAPIATKIQGYREKAVQVLALMESERTRLGIPAAKMIFIAPEHLFRASTQRMAMPEDDKKQVVAAVRTLSQNHPDAMIIPGTIVWLEQSNFARLFRRQFVARNSAFVFVGGREVFRYDKHSNAGELLQAEQADAKFRAGKALGVFRAWGKSFGLEICFDHSNAVLYKQLEAGGRAPVDVHLIVSSTVSNKSGKVAARPGGLIVHADGQDVRNSHTAQVAGVGAKTGVWQMHDRDTPIGGGDGSAEDKRLNRGRYVELQRRNSFTRIAPDVPAGQHFQGFPEDVSVYRVAL
jgi:hypothetical protein